MRLSGYFRPASNHFFSGNRFNANRAYPLNIILGYISDGMGQSVLKADVLTRNVSFVSNTWNYHGLPRAGLLVGKVYGKPAYTPRVSHICFEVAMSRFIWKHVLADSVIEME